MDIMNKTILKPLAMAFIIIGAALTLGFKFYMDNEALSVDRPSFIKTTPDRKVAILFGNSIYFINSQLQSDSVFHFDDLGLKLIGDFDFFSNGDLLIYSNKTEQSFIQKVKQYNRVKETRSTKPRKDNGFYRCQLKTQTCQKFKNNLPAFYTSFRLVIDRNSDTIYIADTPKFVLYKINNQGLLQAQNKDNLNFPNQLYLYNNILYIANTNEHSVKTVNTDNLNFGHEIKSHTTVIDAENRWPSEIIKTPQGWWVGIAGSNMSHGLIQTYDNSWNARNTVMPLQNNPDIWSIAVFNNSVIASDWSNIALYRFNFSGTPLPSLKNTDINFAFKKSIQLKKQYDNSSTNALVAFFFVFGVGLISAFILEKKESLALFKNTEETETINTIYPEHLPSPLGNDVYWIKTKHSKYKIIMSAFLLLMAPIYLWSIFKLFPGDAKIPWALAGFNITIIFLVILLAWSLYRVLSVKIGISGQLLLIDEGNTTIGIGKKTAIQYTNTTIIIGNAVAVIGPPNSPLFPKDEFNKWIKPRMLKGTKISQWSSNKKLWALKHPTIISMITMIIFIIINSFLL